MSESGLSRRAFLGRGAVFAGGIGLSPLLAACRGGTESAGGAVPVGGIWDLTGDLNIYGIQQSQASKMAIDDINENGGVLGREIHYVEYNGQSSLDRFTEYANTLISKNDAVVIVAGLTSASREAIRPIMDRFSELYFYCSLYEGGVCDKNVFVTGPTASQQIATLVKWSVDNLGKRFYTFAPNYNFGTISVDWVKFYAQEYGAEVIGGDFLPLDQSDFRTTIDKLQATRPEVVVALPVGANQTAFLTQFAAAGLKGQMQIISTNYGSGNQQVVVPPEAGDGIYTVLNYVQEVDTPANEDFVARWQERFGSEQPIICEANDVWNAWHLWAMAVEEAGSLKRDPVIEALESGLGFDAPEGHVTLDPATHHLIHEIYVCRGNDTHGFEIVEQFEAVEPNFEMEVCDLVANPDLKEQFTP